MIQLATKLPHKPMYIACSGGVDSMVLLDFLSRNKKRDISVAHVNHGTEYANRAESFVRSTCFKLRINCTVHRVKSQMSEGKSKEEFWRRERLNFFYSLNSPVLTAHHMGDVMEWWVFSALHGKPKLIPTTNKNILRPFLTTSKASIENWAKTHKLKWIDDPSNTDTSFMRNQIRHNIIPEALKVNPGLEKVLRKKYRRHQNVYDIYQT